MISEKNVTITLNISPITFGVKIIELKDFNQWKTSFLNFFTKKSCMELQTETLVKKNVFLSKMITVSISKELKTLSFRLLFFILLIGLFSQKKFWLIIEDLVNDFISVIHKILMFFQKKIEKKK